MAKVGKKAQIFQQLSALAIGVGTLAVVLVVVFLITAQARSQIVDIEGNSTTAYNATVTLDQALDDIPVWIPMIIIAVIGSILIGTIGLLMRKR